MPDGLRPSSSPIVRVLTHYSSGACTNTESNDSADSENEARISVSIFKEGRSEEGRLQSGTGRQL